MKNKSEITQLSHHDILCQMNNILSSKSDAINFLRYFENRLNNCPKEEIVGLEKNFLKWQTELTYKAKLEKQIQAAINDIAYLN